MVHVAPSQRSYEDQVKDRRVDVTGCVELCYIALLFSLYLALALRVF
jgi:hypothetical protein